MRVSLGLFAWILLSLTLGVTGCGREYVCPDPIGPIVRQDCDAYQTQYEAMKLELGVTFAGVGVQAGIGKQAITEPSGLLQAMRLQTEALCRDFNTCRVPSQRYQRLREAHDQRFVSVAALSTGIRQATDAATRRELVDQLIATLAAKPEAPINLSTHRRKTDPFMRTTTVWLDAVNATPMPALPKGVPALADWVARPHNHGGTQLRLRFRGPAEADDWALVSLPGHQMRCVVRPLPKGKTGGTARCVFDQLKDWPESGVMTVSYLPGLTGETTELGHITLSREARLAETWLAFLPTPVKLRPVEHERPWLVLWRPERRDQNVTVRCTLNGKPLGGVIHGDVGVGARMYGLYRYHFALPVGVPRQPEALPASADDLLPAAAAGPWRCTVSVMGKAVRTVEFELDAKGHPKSELPKGGLRSPWWPL